jgi:flagellar protein FlbD
MIQLTRLNSHPLTVNSDLIKFVEQAPDTVLTLVNDEKIVVLESSEQVLEKIIEFRRLIWTGAVLRRNADTPPGESSTAGSGLKVPPHGQE